jgi:hypothetical protein
MAGLFNSDKHDATFPRKVPAMTKQSTVVALALMLTTAGCGAQGFHADEDQLTESLAAKRQETRDKAAAQQRAQRMHRAEEIVETCANSTSQLVGALVDLHARLGVGLSYSEYLAEVGETNVIYKRADVGSLNNWKCLNSVALPAERALNLHIRAASEWSDCVDNYGCDFDQIDPTMQQLWERASTSNDRARTGLRRLKDNPLSALRASTTGAPT